MVNWKGSGIGDWGSGIGDTEDKGNITLLTLHPYLKPRKARLHTPPTSPPPHPQSPLPTEQPYLTLWQLQLFAN